MSITHTSGNVDWAIGYMSLEFGGVSIAKDEVQRLKPNQSPTAKRLSKRGRISKGDSLTDGTTRGVGGKPT